MRRLLVVTLLLLLAALPAAAQSLTGTVSGTVKDEQGGVLPGVNVTLVGRTGTRSVVTGADGTFRFAAVSPGTYSLTAEISGFRPRRQDNVDVSIGRVVELPFSLAVGGVTETVDVVGESPVVDVVSSATDNTLSQDMLFNLPIRPGNAAVEMLNFLPGINSESAFGANGTYGNALLLDGVDTRDPEAGSAWTFFSFNIIDEIQVGGLGAPAEYGGYTGAVVNTLTKSGGNRYSGLFDAYWTKSDFFSDNVSSTVAEANPALTAPAIFNKRLDLNAQLGGPIIRDELFFFVSAQRYEQDQDPTGPRTVSTEVSPRFNTKLTWQPAPNDNVSFNFQWDYYNVTGRTTLGNLTTDAQTVRQDSPEAIWGVQWRHLFGTRTFSEVKYTGWWGYYYLDPISNIPTAYDITAGGYTGGPLYYYRADRGRNQLNASLSHYAEAFGKHDLKFGVEIERSRVRSQFGYNSGLYYIDYTDYYAPGQYLAYGYSYDLETRNQRESVFAQDSWRPTDRLTLNAGVRVDLNRGRSKTLDKKVYSATSWAPRLGFAFDATGDGKTVVKGHYGQYYDGIYSSIYSSAVPGIEDFITFLYDPGGSVCGPLGNCFSEIDRSPSPLSVIDPDIKHPRVDEWTVGVERELFKDVRLSATGIWRQDENIQGTVYPDARWSRISLTSATTGDDTSLNGIPVPAYSWENRSSSEQSILLTNPEGFQYLGPNGEVLGVAGTERKYKGLMLVLDKRFSNRWQGRVSYVRSRSEGYISNTFFNTFGASSFFQTPTLSLVNSFGRTANDRPHELKVFGTWQVPKIEVGLNAYYRYLSGRTYTPFQRFGSSAINYPLTSGRQPSLEPRGSRRYDSESYLDLRLEKIFKIGSGNDRLSVYTDIQNVFNEGTVVARNARHPGASVVGPDPDTGEFGILPIEFNAPTAIVQPRRFLLGARWSF
jgi:outer membrane receptor protein involved in Fe transport